MPDMFSQYLGLVAPQLAQQDPGEPPQQEQETQALMQPQPEENPFLAEIMKTPEQRAQEKLARYWQERYGIKPGAKPSFWQNLKKVFGEVGDSLSSQYAPQGHPYIAPRD